MTPRASAVFLALLLPAVPARGGTLEEELQVWTPIFLEASGPGRLSGTMEVNPRLRGDFRRLSQLLLRPSLGWRAGEGLTLHAGYGWIRTHAAAVFGEHRAWQQLLWQRPRRGTLLAARARVEQRFIEGVPETAHRGRLLARADRRLRGGPWYVAASGKGFLHLNTAAGGPRQGADQTRLFLGLGRRAGPTLRAEGGYQHWWLRRPGREDAVFHVLAVNTYFSAR